jgi:hypothetical protein
MNLEELKSLVKEIVKKASSLKDKYTDQVNIPVNYACIFSQSKEEYDHLINITNEMGKVIKETKSGPLFHIQPLETISGKLLLLKIRNPDPTRPERGDADFTVNNYPEFKEKYLSQNGFKLMLKDDFEMIELMEPGFDVRVYFSDPPLDKQLRLVIDGPVL